MGAGLRGPRARKRRTRWDAAYRLAYSRQPDPWEKDTVATFLHKQKRVIPARRRRARNWRCPRRCRQAVDPEYAAAFVDFCQMLLNSNEFVYQELGDHERSTRARCNRRDFLMRSCGGLGALALSSMLQAPNRTIPLAPKKPHHPPTAKSVILLFMEGGPSHIDLFDPKPELQRLAGQPMPASFGKVDHRDGHGVAIR